jgi:16S rRNA processing protein RimM
LPDRPILLGVPNLLGVPILLGVIGRAHGVSGRVKVTSHTADPSALTGYGPLSDGSGRRFTLRWTGDGIAEIAEIVDGNAVKVTNRTAAERLTNTKLFITREQLPPPDEDEYYHADLIGLTAIDRAGARIGVVSVMHDYGAGVSMEIERDAGGSLLVPFTVACVPAVDIAAGSVTVVPPDEIDAPETASLADKPASDRADPVPDGPRAGHRAGHPSPRGTARNHRKEPGDDGQINVAAPAARRREERAA